MDNNWTVYKHTNKINNKCYIGITFLPPEKRWGKNGSHYKYCPTSHNCFCNAIKKYGWDNFEHDILFTGLSKEEACNKEKELIKFYSSKVPHGYNLTEGGEGTIGRYWTDLEKLKRSDFVKGEKNPRSRKVQYDDMIFGTIDDCANYLNVSRNKIIRWITGKTVIPKIHYDKKLRFLDSEPNYRLKNNIGQSGQKVIYNGVVYPSVAACARVLNVPQTVLLSWLTGKSGLKKENQYLLYTDLSFVGRETKLRKSIHRWDKVKGEI